MICVYESRIYFSVARRNRLEENFFMEPNILNCYEGLGQYTTFYFGSRLTVSAMCSSCRGTEAFVSKDHFEALEVVWDHILI